MMSLSKDHDRNDSVASRLLSDHGFTLVELVLVIVIIVIGYSLVSVSFGVVSFWREENFLRRLNQTVPFLYHQAIADQSFYQIEFDFKERNYKIGVMRPESSTDANLVGLAQDAGSLTLELAAILSPSVGRTYTVIPPPDYPSLADPVPFPEGLEVEDIRTMRGKHMGNEEGKVYILFSPRGFSEFAVMHFLTSEGQPVTILINPFTGTTELFREYKDFEWTYGRQKKDS